MKYSQKIIEIAMMQDTKRKENLESISLMGETSMYQLAGRKLEVSGPTHPRFFSSFSMLALSGDVCEKGWYPSFANDILGIAPTW